MRRLHLHCLRSRSLGDQIVELHLSFGTLESSGMAHNFVTSITVEVELYIGLAVPFGIGNKFMDISAAQKLFGDASLLLNHQRRAFGLPDLHGVLGFRRVDL